MQIASIMTTRLVTARPDDDLKSIKSIFEKAGFHHLLIVDGGKLQGIISDRDLLRNMSPFFGTLSERPQDVATVNKKAHQIMTRALITVAPETALADAIALLLSRKISSLPVVTAEGDLVGIVTWRDLLRASQLPPSSPASGSAAAQTP